MTSEIWSDEKLKPSSYNKDYLLLQIFSEKVKLAMKALKAHDRKMTYAQISAANELWLELRYDKYAPRGRKRR